MKTPEIRAILVKYRTHSRKHLTERKYFMECEDVAKAMQEYGDLRHNAAVEKIKTQLETRISELYAADNKFCEDRWDKSKHELERKIAREMSNSVTMARQELQSILKLITTPRG